MAAIDVDIAGANSHARALDADTKDALHDIHRRVGTVVFFESSVGQTEKVAHLTELRFALGNGVLRKQTAEWTKQRGASARLYPSAGAPRLNLRFSG